MYRAPGLASPYYMPLETEYSGGLELEAPRTEEMEQHLEKAVENYSVHNERRERVADLAEPLTEEERAQLPQLFERMEKLRFPREEDDVAK